MDDLSGDQWLLFEYAVKISQGKVNHRFATWEIGSLNQAIWLTVAIRLICLRTRGTYPWELSEKLNSLIKFIIEVYAVVLKLKGMINSITISSIFSKE